MTGVNPKVSGAILTCDHGEFIGKAVNRALEQDYPDLEIVVAHAAPRDATTRIVPEFAMRFPGPLRPLLHPGAPSIVANIRCARRPGITHWDAHGRLAGSWDYRCITATHFAPAARPLTRHVGIERPVCGDR